MEYLDKLFKVLNLQPRLLLGLSILGCILLYNPYGILNEFGLETLVNLYRPWVGFTTLFAFVFFFIQLIPWVKDKIEYRQYKLSLLEELDSLSKEEKVLLLYCLDNNQKTISLPMTHSTANRLTSKNIMLMASGAGNLTSWAFNINDIVWSKLKKNRELLTAGLSEQEVKATLSKMFSSLYN